MFIYSVLVVAALAMVCVAAREVVLLIRHGPTTDEDLVATGTVEESVHHRVETWIDGVLNQHGDQAPELLPQALVQAGRSRDEVILVVREFGRRMLKERYERAQKNMTYGAAWCFGGTLLTAGALMSAAESGGGTYAVFWGAIAVGGIQLLRGIAQNFSYSSDLNAFCRRVMRQA